jgi:hypothetical protein
VALLEKFFFGRNLKGGTKVKFTPPFDFLRKLREKLQRIFLLESRKTLKGGPKEIFWTKFRNVSQKYFLWSSL